MVSRIFSLRPPFLALLIFSVCLQTNAMEQERSLAPSTVPSDAKIGQLKLDDIKPFQATPIYQIPDLAYANPNQVTQHNWTPQELTALKQRAESMVLEKLATECEELGLTEREFFKRGELYDWVYVLTLIEKSYLTNDTELTIKDCKIINAAITRLDTGAPKPGEFRDEPVIWLKKELTFTENVFNAYKSTYIKRIVAHQDPYLRFNKPYVELASIVSLFEFLKKEKKFIEMLENEYRERKMLIPEIDIEEIKKWDQLQKHLPSYKQGHIDVVAWELEHFHFFPDAKDIEPLLKTMLEESKRFKHPIARAAYIWVYMVKIHPFSEAHKRTGKALASIILYRNGYLAPLITKEDSERYTQIFLENLNKEDGFYNFIAFIAELVKKTQEKAALAISSK